MVEKSHTAGWWPDLQTPLRGLSTRIADWFAPASEAAADEDCYEIVVELPGVGEDDIDVSVHGNVLEIKGEKRSEDTREGKSYYFSERTYGMFQRSFRLPKDATSDKIAAGMKNGVLTIRIPKVAAEKATARRIKITQG